MICEQLVKNENLKSYLDSENVKQFPCISVLIISAEQSSVLGGDSADSFCFVVSAASPSELGVVFQNHLELLAQHDVPSGLQSAAEERLLRVQLAQDHFHEVLVGDDDGGIRGAFGRALVYFPRAVLQVNSPLGCRSSAFRDMPLKHSIDLLDHLTPHILQATAYLLKHKGALKLRTHRGRLG